MKQVGKVSGPIMIVIKIGKNQKSSKRVSIDTVSLKKRFSESIKN